MHCYRQCAAMRAFHTHPGIVSQSVVHAQQPHFTWSPLPPALGARHSYCFHTYHLLGCKKYYSRAHAQRETDNTHQEPAEASQQAAESSDSGTMAQTAQQQSGPEDEKVEAVKQAATSVFAQLQALITAAIGLVKLVFVSFIYESVWARRRKLQQLQEAAKQSPSDPAVVGAYITELSGKDPKELLQVVDGQPVALDDRGVVEYIKALVKTKEIDKYAEASDTGTRNYASIAQLLEKLRNKVNGQTTVGPGETLAQPLFVQVQREQQAQGNPLVRAIGFVFGLISTYLFLALAWLVGSSLVMRYSTGAALSSSSLGLSAARATSASAERKDPSSAYAPKEYNKEAMPETSVKTFNDVKGCDEAKAELEEIVEYLKNPEKFTRLGGKLPKGVLLTGPPGTGKTLLAKATAGEAGVPFFFRSGSEFEEMYVGVGARRVRSLFSAAKKKGPCIVFIDEIDAIGGSRKSWENNTRKTLNQLLVEMDGFEANEGVIVMACTNIPEALDPALTRPGRFDRIVAVPLPDVKGREEIVRLYLEGKPVLPEVDAKYQARRTPGFSGAELFNMVNEAALLAAKHHQDFISNALLDEARDKIIMGTARKTLVQSSETRKLTAFHEAGHAIVALKTKGALPIHKATIMPRGMALGYVSQVPEGDKLDVTKQELLARIDVAMGGRVAEELVFGGDNITTGAVDDFRQATHHARSMVTQWGMSDLVGPIYVGDNVSPDMRRVVDQEIGKVLKDSISRVRSLLTAHNADLHTLANALLEYETLTLEDIHKVLKGESLATAPAATKPVEGLAPAELSVPEHIHNAATEVEDGTVAAASEGTVDGHTDGQEATAPSAGDPSD